MGQLTSREIFFMVVIAIFGTIFFLVVCAWIYYFFKRLENRDRAETERYSEASQDDELKS